MTEMFEWMDSPIGRLRLVASDAELSAVLWENDIRKWRHLQGPQVESPDHPVLVDAEQLGLLAVEGIKHRPSARDGMSATSQPRAKQSALDLACPA